MDNLNYRMIAQKADGEKIKVASDNCHEAKSLAGTMFHYAENIVSVLVADISGKVWLYLNKERPKEVWVNESSTLAPY